MFSHCFKFEALKLFLSALKFLIFSVDTRIMLVSSLVSSVTRDFRVLQDGAIE